MNSAAVKITIQKLVTIFILAFLFNLLWENLHAQLYIHYQGDVITELILIKAALFDAAFITTVCILFLPLPFRTRLIIVSICCLIFAIALERYALITNRWEYNSLMPIIPILKSGLTPTIQLASLSFLAIFITEKFYDKNN